MGIKTGYMMLGSGIIGIGVSAIIPTSSFGNTGAQAGIGMGLGCLAGLIGFIGFVLVVVGNIVLFVKRKELDDGGKRGAKIGLIGLISVVALFIITLVLAFLMVISLMANGIESGGAEEESGIMVESIFQWSYALMFVGLLSAIAQIMAEGGPSFWSKNRTASILAIVGGILVLIMVIASTVFSLSMISGIRDEYKDTDISDEEEMNRVQEKMQPLLVDVLKGVSSIGHFLMGAAAFIAGSSYGSKGYGRDHRGYSYSYPPDNEEHEPRVFHGGEGMTCPSCGNLVGPGERRCPFCFREFD